MLKKSKIKKKQKKAFLERKRKKALIIITQPLQENLLQFDNNDKIFSIKKKYLRKNKGLTGVIMEKRRIACFP